MFEQVIDRWKFAQQVRGRFGSHEETKICTASKQFQHRRNALAARASCRGLTRPNSFRKVLRKREWIGHKNGSRRGKRKSPQARATGQAIIDLLSGRNKQARFMTELYAALGRYQIGKEEADRALVELEARAKS